MATCSKHSCSASWAYKRHRCRCESCLSWKREAAARTNNKELAKRRSREWRLKYPHRSRANAKSYQARNLDKVLGWKLKRYGITHTDYAQLLAQQNGVCAICHKECGTRSRLAVDHDHKTGLVRGLLCNQCNTALGKFHDSPALLRAAITYIGGK